jgi:hypothetical protein
VAALLDGALTGFAPLSALVLVATLLWLRQRRLLGLLLLPVSLQLVLASVKYANVWHEGAVLLSWLFALAVSFDPRLSPAPDSGESPRLRQAAVGALAAVCAIQVYWCASTVAYDLRHPYSGSAAAAAYLHELDAREPGGLRARGVAGLGLPAYAVLPYFEENLFTNHNGGERPAFYRWTTRPPEPAAGQPPELVVVGFKRAGVYLGTAPTEVAGYRLERLFPGALYWKTAPFEDDAVLVFRREATGAPVRAPGFARTIP